jgi:hypothetical protein
VFHQLLFYNVVGNGSAMVFPRAAALAAGGYRDGQQGSEDADLQLRLAHRGRVAVVPECLVGYRNRPGSMSKARVANLRLAIETVDRNARLDGADPQIFRWVRGNLRVLMGLAMLSEGGGVPAAAGAILQALWENPAAVSARLVRHASFPFRRMFPRRPPAETPRDFFELDPREGIVPLEERLFTGQLRRSAEADLAMDRRPRA